jgi:hypothetical protein
LFYVLGEEIQLIVPPNAAAILRMQAAGWTDIEPSTTSPLDGSLMRAIFAHEEAEGRYGGIAGLLAEREVSFRDPEVQQILDQCRERKWSEKRKKKSAREKRGLEETEQGENREQ